MPAVDVREPRSGASVTSDDRQTSSTLAKRTKLGGVRAQSSKGLNALNGPRKKASNDALILENRLAEVVLGDEWNVLLHDDPQRAAFFSNIQEQLQKSLNALAYINKLESRVNQPASGIIQDSSSRCENVEAEPEYDKKMRDFVAEASPQQNSETSAEWKVEIKRWKRVDGRTGSIDFYDEMQKIEDIRRRDREIQGGTNIINVYDVYESEGSECQTFLEILSTPLIDLLRKVIRFYPGEEFDILMGVANFAYKDFGTGAVVFRDPFLILLTNKKKLEDSLDQNFPDDAKKHLRELLKFMNLAHPHWSDKLTEIEQGKSKVVGFHTLWLLYPPNTPVYVRDGADDRQVVVYSRELYFRRQTSGSTRKVQGPITLKCWDIKYEQRTFKRTFSTFVIEPFAGARPIEQLQLVPCSYMPNEAALSQRLIDRGRRYFKLKQGAQLQDYTGECFPRVFSDESVRVVVDEDTYRRKYPYQAQRNETISEIYGFPPGEQSLVDESNQPLDSTLLRCFPEVGVFSLKDRQWGLVKVDDLKPVQFREKAFNRLILQKDYKGLLKALVRASKQETANFSDIVPGKGRGLAILLHGPPGTGKTLTAECIAEKEQRPLYTISCSDLGTEPDQLEQRLKEVFEHAVAWNAILLLDESEIFLQVRDANDLKRNALVTIFLRELEYFDGVIFMTTNRPGDIDEAFVSRIHVTIELPSPRREEQMKIWRIFIKELDMPEKQQRELLNSVTKFESDNLNGRQIRNTIRVALALAKLEDRPVHPDHLEEVIKIGREYAHYNENLNKMKPEELAIQMGTRAQQE